jgi:hypothetical protein
MTDNKNESKAATEETSSEDKPAKVVVASKPGEQINPLGDEMNIMVSIPETLEIKMVNAAILSDYEIWFFISSVLSSVMIGFWVAYIQNTNEMLSNILFWNSSAFSLFFLIAVIVAFVRRKKLNEKAKSVMLKASKAIPK